eukprot:TRINITY_DN28962_c0_g2_i1.p1 TRINITY_DN28962_c0_g2~~TRINITY_DN28962_c0_g2_i1.p1  ORF type:complete len:498 (+),score=67.59 TRINITY_DN28962_c0_g2_i1:50-1543(+)
MPGFKGLPSVRSCQLSDAPDSQRVVVRDGVRWAHLLCCCAASCVDGLDSQLLPASFRALEVQFGLTPSQLGVLCLLQAVVKALVAPAVGALVDNGFIGEKRAVTLGMLGWSSGVILLSACHDVYFMGIVRVLNSIALAGVVPVSQTIIARDSDEQQRGAAFGWLQLGHCTGQAIGAVFTASFAGAWFLSVPGWRLTFAALGLAAYVLGIAMEYVMEPSEMTKAPSTAACASPTSSWQLFSPAALSELAGHLRPGTVKALLIEAACRPTPWSALSFTVVYLQYLGIPDFSAARIYSMLWCGGAVGGLVGGRVGDSLASYSRFHGRPFTGQASALFAITFVLVAFLAIPWGPATGFLFALTFFLLGLTGKWIAVGVSRPILTEVIPPSSWTSILGFVVAIEALVPSVFGIPLVGMLAEREFGYRTTMLRIAQMPASVRHADMDALAHAILCCTVGPWVVCFFLFSYLHVSYRKDTNALAVQCGGKSQEADGVSRHRPKC